MENGDKLEECREILRRLDHELKEVRFWIGTATNRQTLLGIAERAQDIYSVLDRSTAKVAKLIKDIHEEVEEEGAPAAHGVETESTTWSTTGPSQEQMRARANAQRLGPDGSERVPASESEAHVKDVIDALWKEVRDTIPPEDKKPGERKDPLEEMDDFIGDICVLLSTSIDLKRQCERRGEAALTRSMEAVRSGNLHLIEERLDAAKALVSYALKDLFDELPELAPNTRGRR